MIVTVTPNPSVDRTLMLPALRRGEVNRATVATAEAGGKGINVARALTTMGSPAIAIAPLAPTSHALLAELLGDTVDLRAVPIAGEVRVNVSIVEPDGTTTKVNEPGPAVDAAATERLLDAIASTIASIDLVAWVVGCGSLPPGVPDDVYARLADRMPTSIRTAIDADRGALRAVIGGRVSLIKPNRSELEELVGRPLETLGDVVDAAAGLLGGGLERVLVSLGPDGAVVVGRDEACHATAGADQVVNTVGAGDALLAGFLSAGATAGALPTAVAWSMAACRAPGTRMPPVTDRDRAAVVVQPAIDRSLILSR